jgi:hypothetical protein
MTQSDIYANLNTVHTVQNILGGDVSRDALKVALAFQDVELTTALDHVGGQAQSAVDLAARIDALADALAKNAGDELRVTAPSTLPVDQQTAIEIGTWSGGTLPTDQQTPIEVGTWSAGVLSVTDDGALVVDDYTGTTLPVEQQTPVEIGTWSGGTLPVEDRNDWAIEDGTALASGATTEQPLAAEGAEDIRLRISRATTSYDVEIDWEDDTGTVIWTESVATGVAGGTETKDTIPASTPYATVRVADAGSSSGAVTATYNMR